MILYEKIKEREESLSLVGLGYVGMPIAVEFAKRGIKVVGFDVNATKIETYRSRKTVWEKPPAGSKAVDFALIPSITSMPSA